MGLSLAMPKVPTGARVVADIGGSGMRIAALATGGQVMAIERVDCASVDDLFAAVRRVDQYPQWFGLSVAGPIRAATGEVLACHAAPWLVGDLRRSLSQELGCEVAVVNDGTAHAMALRTIPDAKFGAICLAVGSGLAFGVLSEQGEPTVALSGVNWEIGDLELKTRASNPWAWWALGENGVDELIRDLGKEDGLLQLGHRLGALARKLAIILQPRTIGFSGGYAARYWRWLEPGIRQELGNLTISGETPIIVANAQAEPALAGLAQLAPPSNT